MGALTTVVVAWLIVIFMPRLEENWPFPAVDVPATETIEWPTPVPASWPACQSRNEATAFGREVITWSGRTGPRWRDACMVRIHRTGWPLLAMQSHWRWGPPNSPVPTEETGIGVGVGDGVVALPLRPIALGFGVNSFIAAVLCFGVLSCVPFLRRERGSRMCPECGGGPMRSFAARAVVASLLLGGAATIGLSWLSVVLPQPTGGFAYGSGRNLTARTWEGSLFPASIFRPWPVAPPDDWPQRSLDFSLLGRFPKPGMMSRSASGAATEGAPPGRFAADWDGSGWPLLAMQSRRLQGGSLHVPDVSFDSGIRTKEWGASVPGGAGAQAYLPLRPIPFGFAFNTLFFAAAAFIPFITFVGVRRAIRRRRGSCEWCGYSLRGLVR